ncbi:hypothetical protein WJX84_012058 [Apatococcus fuscideae]|uniref:LysM domain-containing protein n=1 Tax=Apatococcus fuscideae TaxID=2026836 RepID=A0AAW1ST37_9CHLO
MPQTCLCCSRLVLVRRVELLSKHAGSPLPLPCVTARRNIVCRSWRQRRPGKDPPPPADKYLIPYEVQLGDSVESIAQRLRVEPSIVLEANEDSSEVKQGEVLKLWLPDSTQAALVEQQEQAAPAADVANASSHENTMPAQEAVRDDPAAPAPSKGEVASRQLRQKLAAAQRMHASLAPPPPLAIVRKMMLGPFGVALALGVMFYSFQRAMTWRRARTRSQDSAVAPTTPLPPEDSAINEPGPRRTEVKKGWIQPPAWMQQPGNVWMDLTGRLEGLGPGPDAQDRDCLLIFEDREEGMGYARARSRIHQDGPDLEGIQPMAPYDVLEQAVNEEISIACFYRGSLGSGIENMGEQELIRKLQIAAQVCTYSLASTILKQPQQQFYQPPPPASSPRSAPSPASRDQGLMTADVTEKVPFKKGKWLGGKEVEGLVNKRQQRAVDDAPSISKEDRARGYKRMRAPSQSQLNQGQAGQGPPSPNSPEQWPANAAPKAHLKEAGTGTLRHGTAAQDGTKWHARPASSLKAPRQPFNAQLQMAALDWAIFDAMVQDLWQRQQRLVLDQQDEPLLDADAAVDQLPYHLQESASSADEGASSAMPSMAWVREKVVHVIWRAPATSSQTAEGTAPPGNPLCLTLLDKHDTMVVMQDGREAEEAARLLEGILQRVPNRAAERIMALPVPPAFLAQSGTDPRRPHLCWLSTGAITVSQLRQLRKSRDAMAAFRTLQQAGSLIRHEQLLPGLQQAKEAEAAREREQKEMADMMKEMFESGSDGQAAAGMFGNLPFSFPGQPPEGGAVPDADSLLEQLQAMMGEGSPGQPSRPGVGGEDDDGLDAILHEDLIPVVGNQQGGRQASPSSRQTTARALALAESGRGNAAVAAALRPASSRTHPAPAAAAAPGERGPHWWTRLPHVYLPFRLSQGPVVKGQLGVDHGAFIVDISEDGPPQPCLLAFQDVRDVDDLLQLHRHRWERGAGIVDVRHMRPREVAALARSQGATVAVFGPGELPLENDMSEQDFVAMSAAYARP